jgi:hypothetical protein
MVLIMQNDSLTNVQTIRLWAIENNKLREINKPKLDLEERLEDWLASDVSIISPNLLFLGRQVPTDFGGFIDILCMEEDGDLVIIELKKDKTPRDITAQTLDYASWVKNLTADQVQKIAEKGCKKSLEEIYEAKFNHDMPESINQEHKMLVVGSEIDSATQRIINYLSETFGVGINAITFNYFKDVASEFVARTFLIEPSRAETQSSRLGKRRPNLTEEQLQAIADDKEVGELYKTLVNQLYPLFDYKGTTHTTIAFVGKLEGISKTIFSLVPQESNLQNGLKFRVYLKRLAENFKISEAEATSLLPKNKKQWKYYRNAPPEYSGFEGFFKEQSEVMTLVKGLKKEN